MGTITARILQSTGLDAAVASIAPRELGITSDTERPVMGSTVGGAKFIGTEELLNIITISPAAIPILRRTRTTLQCDTAAAGANIDINIENGAQVAGSLAFVIVDGPGTRQVNVTYASGQTEIVVDGNSMTFEWTGTKWIKTGLINSPTADEKAALAGTAGTPSGTNKYVTNDDKVNFTTAHDATLTGTGAVASPLSVFNLSGRATLQVFNTAGANTWTNPGCKHAIFTFIGASGGGGVGDSDNAGNGGGGGCGGLLQLYRNVDAVASVGFTLGAAGAGGTTGAGTDGGASTIGGFTIGGGAGGQGGDGTRAGGAGGTISGSDGDYTTLFSGPGGAGGNGEGGNLGGGGGGGIFGAGSLGNVASGLWGTNTAGPLAIGANPAIWPPACSPTSPLAVAGVGNPGTANAPARADRTIFYQTGPSQYIIGGGGGTGASSGTKWDGAAGAKAICIVTEYY